MLGILVLALSAFFGNAQTLSCPGAPAPITPIVAGPGFVFTPVVGNLKVPRGITRDSKGNILVVESGKGISAHIVDADGCVTSSKLIVNDTVLNHGIDVFGTQLYATSSNTAWVWEYDPTTLTASNRQIVVTGMDNAGSKPRSLLVSRKDPKNLVVSVGTGDSIDTPSNPPGYDRASIKVFDLTAVPAGGYQYRDSGKLFAYGVRNVVALAEDSTGVFHGAENAKDDAYRLVNGTRINISDDNPAENIFELGDPAGPEGFFGGYPTCFVVWEPNNFRDAEFKPGDWFVQEPTATLNDTSCESLAKKPSAILTAHVAPLGMKFGVGSDSHLYVGMHGRWHTDLHVGYKVVSIPGFISDSGWKPIEPLSSRQGTIDVLANVDATACQPKCLHPVDLVWSEDGQNLYVTSDTSGEIFLVKKA